MSRCLALCTGGLLLLDIWAWVAPGVLAPKGTVRLDHPPTPMHQQCPHVWANNTYPSIQPQEHTVADFDTSSLLYLAPLTLHALAALAFFTRSVNQSTRQNIHKYTTTRRPQTK